jgi:CRISPR-associated protein Csb2
MSAMGTQTETRPGLTISLRFTTGRCVTTSVSSRYEPEWPPHPGRVFMAMAAAFFESEGTEEEKQSERQALNWLAAQDNAPEIRAVEAPRRSEYTCYVPVNDNVTPNKAMLQSAPGLPRSRQPRMFPTVVPEGGDDCFPHVQLIWDCGAVSETYFEAIDRICRNVIRVGHSSSLVMAWANDFINEDAGALHRWVQTPTAAALSCRIATTGELDRLQAACRAEQIDQFAELTTRILDSSGKAKLAAKVEFEEAFGEPFKQSLRPPEPLPPTISSWHGYSRQRPQAAPTVANAYFERELLIFEIVDGPSLNIERTLNLTRALRDAAMSACPIQPPPSWLSGHEEDGSPATSPHAAFACLPFAGSKWADGHIIGLAMAMPKGISVEERGECLAPLIVNQHTGDLQDVRFQLWGKDLPDLILRLCTQPSPPTTLANETWTKPSKTWASVTPVVLDKFPKQSMIEDHNQWHADVCRIISLSCERAGLPVPVQIGVNTTALHRGIPRAIAKTRRTGKEPNPTAPLGDGFPPLSLRKSQPPKPQVHVCLEFDEQVSGPVLIGAGRFTGYGLCLPKKSTLSE